MKTKLLEIRDEGTFIPMLCIDMMHDVLTAEEMVGLTEAELRNRVEDIAGQRYLLRRCGYPCDGRPNIAMTPLDAGGKPCWNDPYGWSGRTFPVAHNYIIEHWHELRDGDVVDVAFILGETTERKRSERERVPL